jgi:hypothetical protein
MPRELIEECNAYGPERLCELAAVYRISLGTDPPVDRPCYPCPHPRTGVEIGTEGE